MTLPGRSHHMLSPHISWLFPLPASAVARHHRILHCTCSSHSKSTPCNQQGMDACYISGVRLKANTLHHHWDESRLVGLASARRQYALSESTSLCIPLDPTW